ncbi:MAG: glycosyltransferase [Ilumatobacteraceae bacterium]
MFDHLLVMTDRNGLFEHADHDVPRIEHGYCTDDNARMLVVTAREPDEGVPARLSRVALAFTMSSLAPDGRVHNRMDGTGRFIDQASNDDCWGRALWGLGVAATHHDDPEVRLAARASFGRAARQRSPWSRAMAFASLGAAAVASTSPDDEVALVLLQDAVEVIGTLPTGTWRWPEDRLRYANAALAEATLSAGALLGDSAVLDRGLDMLEWLLARETTGGHLSVTGSGADHVSLRPQFDQQPIEVAAIADACWAAFALTGDRRWRDGLTLAAGWFEGENDVGAVMHDLSTGGGYDGLTPTGPNLNQGAESTLAYISTRQRVHCLVGDPA